MQTSEPMMMGSPSSPMMMGSPSSPGTTGHGQPFLPAFLMGEPSPMTSPQTRLWSTSASSSPPRTLNRSSALSPPQGTTFSHTPQSANLSRTREIMGGRGKDKTGAPPVAGLLEHITSPTSASDRRVEMNSSRTAGQTLSFLGTSQHNITDLNISSACSPANTSQAYMQPRKTPPSPAQIDPFYTQGESIGPDSELDDTWITIFGFPAAATSFILQQFSQYGNILKHVVASDGNWLHIRYQSKLQAKKALSKNGKVFGNSIMVGVSRCIDKNVMEGEKENSRLGVLSTPTQPLTPGAPLSSKPGTPIRPLTAAYKAAQSDHEVVHKSNTPQKSNNLISKAMEYMFGW